MAKVISFFKLHLKSISLIVIGLLLGGIGSSMVFASVPDVSGAVHACYKTGGLFPNGAVRFIDKSTQSCSGTETEVSLDKATPGNFLTNLVGADFTSASLPYRNFSGQDMHGSTFTSSVISGTDFSGANLSSSIFNAPQARDTKIVARKVNLSGVNFSNSSFANYIDFTDTVFNGTTNFNNTSWDGVNITGGDFRNADFDGASFAGLSFTGSNLAGYDFDISSTSAASLTFYDATNLSNAKFTGYSGGQDLYSAFYGVDLSGADFRGSVIHSAFGGSNMSSANFTNDSFTDASLAGSDFSSAILTGASWSNTTCPDGTNSDSNGNTCIGHLVP